MKVAFVGLGVMGYPMARHLLNAGHDVCVYNRTTARAEDWVKTYGGSGSMAGTPAEAAGGCDIVFACVGNDDDLRSVTLGGAGAFAGMESGTIFVDHTTTSASVARELHARALEAGIAFIDAPISGGQAGAENGALTVMCGGDAEPYALAEPVMSAYARQCKLLGPSGAGQTAKMANQICIAGLVQGLSEALAFVQKANLDGREVVSVISEGAAQSWQMENRYEWMIDGTFEDNKGFAIDWMRKDLAICLEEGKRVGAALPVTELVDGYYAELQQMGYGRKDTSSLIDRLLDR